MIQLVLQIYSFFKKRTWLLMLLVGSMVLCCAFLLSGIKLEERITDLLPEGKGRLSSDLALLQSAPLQKKLVITLHASTATVQGKSLASATKQVAQWLQPPLFSKVSYSVDTLNPHFFIALRNMVPALFNLEIKKQLINNISPSAISSSLKSHKQSLSTMNGVLNAQTIAADPLNFHKSILPELSSVAYMKNLRIQHGVFMTPDGKHSMIIAETPVSSTDSATAVLLENELMRIEQMLPDNVTWSVLGAQRYTAANATTIKNDISRTSIIAVIALLTIVLFFLRTKKFLFILLLPLLAYVGGATAVTAIWKPASAMTFGFGPVLAGMAIDFGLHLYYVFDGSTPSKPALLTKTVQPILISGGTTIAAFSLLLLSPVPGLRQLSLFIVIGLITALLLTLFVLPHLLDNKVKTTQFIFLPPSKKSTVAVVAGLILLVAVFGASKVTVQKHIRDLGIKPATLLAIEKETQEIWGNKAGHALLFTSGTSIDEAISNTASGIALLPTDTQRAALGISSLMPPQKIQQTNIMRWNAFAADNQEILSALQKEAANQGYSAKAFSSFYSFMQSQPQMVTLSTLQALGLNSMLESFVVPHENTSRKMTVISYLPDTAEVNNAFTPKLEKKHDLRLVSQSRLGQEMAETLASTFFQYIGYTLCIIIVVIALVHRSVRQCCSTLLPACAGLLVMVGTFGLFNRPLSIFSMAGTLLVLGHGVDYGVYATHAINNENKAVPQAILVSGLTSLAGFGALLFADHPALYDMGLSVFSGLLAAIPAALILLPSLYSKEHLR